MQGIFWSNLHILHLNLIPLQQGHLTKPSVDQGSALAGRGGAPLGLDVHSGRQVLLPPSISSLWQGNETPRAPRAAPRFPFFSVSLSFQSLFLSLSVICPLPTHKAALSSASQASYLLFGVSATPLLPMPCASPKFLLLFGTLCSYTCLSARPSFWKQIKDSLLWENGEVVK